MISLIHTYAHGKASSQALQSNKSCVFYPRSQQSRCIQFMRDYLQLSTSHAKELVKKFASCCYNCKKHKMRDYLGIVGTPRAQEA